MIRLKHVYPDTEEEDGYRILVDRFRPRGISKEKAQLDLWLKEIVPSNEARKTFDHVLGRFASFTKKYQQELIFEEEKRQAIFRLSQLMKEHSVITFVYGTKNEHQNHVVLSKKFIEVEACK